MPQLQGWMPYTTTASKRKSKFRSTGRAILKHVLNRRLWFVILDIHKATRCYQYTNIHTVQVRSSRTQKMWSFRSCLLRNQVPDLLNFSPVFQLAFGRKMILKEKRNTRNARLTRLPLVEKHWASRTKRLDFANGTKSATVLRPDGSCQQKITEMLGTSRIRISSCSKHF